MKKLCPDRRAAVWLNADAKLRQNGAGHGAVSPVSTGIMRRRNREQTTPRPHEFRPTVPFRRPTPMGVAAKFSQPWRPNMLNPYGGCRPPCPVRPVELYDLPFTSLGGAVSVADLLASLPLHAYLQPRVISLRTRGSPSFCDKCNIKY